MKFQKAALEVVSWNSALFRMRKCTLSRTAQFAASVLVAVLFAGNLTALHADATDFTFTIISVPGASPTAPLGINDQGQIIGVAVVNGTDVGFLDSGGSFTTFTAPGASLTDAWDINDGGQIVGTARFGTALGQAFLYSGGSFTFLTAPGMLTTTATGINNNGQIVGTAIHGPAGPPVFGFLDSNGNFSRFNVPGSTFTDPQKINDNGQIVGVYGTTSATFGFLDTGGTYSTIEFPGQHLHFS